MKRYQIKLAGLILLCSLLPGHAIYAEDSGQHEPEKQNPGRQESSKPKVSEKFDELIKVLVDKKEGTFIFNLKKDKDSSESQVTLTTENIAQLKQQLETVKKYADKLLRCGEGANDDKVSSALLATLNEFVNYIVEKKAVGQFTSRGTLISKDINTFVVRFQKSLEEKTTKFSKSKNEFEKADKEVSEQLEAVAKLLQGGSWDKTAFDTDSVEKDLAIKAIKDSSADAKMCKLDETATTDSTANNNGTNNNNGANNGGNAAPPVVDPSLANGTGTPGTPNGFIPPNPIPNGNAIVPGDFRTNQLEDLLRRAQDDRDRDRLLNEELLRRQFNEDNRDSDQALRALQQALGQAQRPNVSRGNSDRSEQGPQLSPSVSIPPSQQQPIQPMQLPQIPPPQPMPLGSLLNNGPTQPMIPYTPSRFNDDIAARPATPAQPDPTTTALLQTMQQQNQMFQQMLMSQNQNMNNGVANVRGTVGNAFQTFAGPRFSIGPARAAGGGRILPSRFNGNARSGVQGKIGANPSGRGPLPSRLSR